MLRGERLAKQNGSRKIVRLQATRLIGQRSNDLPSLNLRMAADSFLKLAKP